ncbi:hypothetical protein [Hoylesella timonensis]|uniref:hypothetical protein n=1 Tax=Hoylesella timonensis TaxID=386414 RepID=UPI001E4CDD15|nr:hypothetical protein [Hoylesella timonensis]
MKEIYSHINDGRSVFSKPKRTDRAIGFTYYCECPNKCNLFSRGKCLLKNMTQFCKYGMVNRVQSPTVIAKSYRTFIDNFKEEHKETIDKQLYGINKICDVVDLVFLPVNFLHMNRKADFSVNRDFGFGGQVVMVEKSKFTKEFIDEHILQFRPRSYFGYSTIKDYGKKSLPIFMNQLKDYNIQLFHEVIAMRPEYNELYSNISNVGRIADLRTLTPNKGTFVDCHGANWIWDGEYLVSNDSDCAFMPIDSSNFSQIKVKVRIDIPTRIKIADDWQVNDNTVFFD